MKAPRCGAQEMGLSLSSKAPELIPGAEGNISFHLRPGVEAALSSPPPPPIPPPRWSFEGWRGPPTCAAGAVSGVCCRTGGAEGGEQPSGALPSEVPKWGRDPTAHPPPAPSPGMGTSMGWRAVGPPQASLGCLGFLWALLPQQEGRLGWRWRGCPSLCDAFRVWVLGGFWSFGGFLPKGCEEGKGVLRGL